VAPYEAGGENAQSEQSYYQGKWQLLEECKLFGHASDSFNGFTLIRLKIYFEKGIVTKFFVCMTWIVNHRFYYPSFTDTALNPSGLLLLNGFHYSRLIYSNYMTDFEWRLILCSVCVCERVGEIERVRKRGILNGERRL